MSRYLLCEGQLLIIFSSICIVRVCLCKGEALPGKYDKFVDPKRCDTFMW